MDSKRFNDVVKQQIARSTDVLVKKQSEYSSDTDRLHQFKVGAVMKGETPRAVLAGMMMKHTTSVYDMCMAETEFTLSMWDEKITDHINYLLLLRAVVQEDYDALVELGAVTTIDSE